MKLRRKRNMGFRSPREYEKQFQHLKMMQLA